MTRRAAVAGLAAAFGAAASGCGIVAEEAANAARGPERSGAGTQPPGPSPSSVPSTTGATPTATPTPRPTFVSDYALPPVQGGLAPVVTRVTTRQPVVFLTIDDGVAKSPEAIALLKRYDYPVSLFLTKSLVADNPGYFKELTARGDRIQNHTANHDTGMSRKPYAYQLAEITAMQEYSAATYGVRPTLFRPPGGAYSPAMRQAVAAAGLKAIIHWEAKSNAGKMDYQYGAALRPGDIVLMHFRPEFAADLEAFRAAQLAAGLTVVRLEEFVGA